MSDVPDWATPEPAPDWAEPTATPAPAVKTSPLRGNQPISMAENPEAMKGLGQAGLNMAIGAITAPIAGGIGVLDVAKNLLQGKDFDTAMGAGADISQKIQQKAGSIVPQNPTAIAAQQGLAKPIEAVKGAMGEGARYVGEAHGMGPQGQAAMQSAGEALPDVAATLFGAVPAVRGARAAQTVKPVIGQAQDAALRAKTNGYLASPSETNPTMTNKVGTAIANADKLNDELAVKNAANTTRLAKEELGISGKRYLNEKTLAPLKEAANEKYAALKTLKDVDLTPDEVLRSDLATASHPNANLKATQPEYYNTPGYERIRAEVLNPAKPWTTTTLMDHIAELRHDANKLFKKNGVSRAEERDAQAMRNVADHLENFMERKLTTDVYTGGEATAATRGPQGILPGQPKPAQLPGRSQVMPYSSVGPEVAPGMPKPASTPPGMGQNPSKHGGTMEHQSNAGRAKLIEDWKQARQDLAKIHDVEAATNLETGHVDPAKLARIEENGGVLTGNLAKIVQAHRAMPHVVKNVEKGSQSALRAGDAAVGGAVLRAAHTLAGAGSGAAAGSAFGPVGAAVGAGAGLVVPIATRKLMSSGLYQKYMANPSPALLDQIRDIDPKTAAALTAASASRTNTPLPAPMEQPK